MSLLLWCPRASREDPALVHGSHARLNLNRPIEVQSARVRNPRSNMPPESLLDRLGCWIPARLNFIRAGHGRPGSLHPARRGMLQAVYAACYVCSTIRCIKYCPDPRFPILDTRSCILYPTCFMLQMVKTAYNIQHTI